jgi:hypothetical protein
VRSGLSIAPRAAAAAYSCAKRVRRDIPPLITALILASPQKFARVSPFVTVSRIVSRLMKCGGFPEENYCFYTLGSLEEPETEDIRGHLSAGCTTCHTEVAAHHRLWFAIAIATPSMGPRRMLRDRVVASVGGGMAWWRQPLRMLAAVAMLLLSVTGGLMFNLRRPPSPPIAFSPVYTAPVPAESNRVPGVPESKPEVVIRNVEKIVSDPTQAQAIAALNQDLAKERARAAQLDADLTQQRTLVAAAQRAAQDSEQKYLAAVKSAGDEAQRKLAALTAQTKELERQVAAYRVLLETQRNRLDQNLMLASMVSDPQLRVVKMRATEKGKTVEGHALIAGGSQLAFYASQLPALPPDRVYQLWLIRSNGKAIASAGLFSPDAASRAALQLRDPVLLSGVTTLAVTDEPAGGSTLPTGHKWLIGS